MNSGWQTKNQVKNTECRSKPSQLQLIRRKTGCAASKPSLFQESSAVCFAVGCIKACVWVWKEHQPSGFKHFSWILNGLRCFSLASLHTWCIPDVFASLSTSPHLTYHQLLNTFLFPEHLQRAAQYRWMLQGQSGGTMSADPVVEMSVWDASKATAMLWGR